MPGKLDLDIARIVADLTAPGATFECERVLRDGIELPAMKHAPENLPALFERFCGEHAGAEFLVDGPVRLTFSQVHGLAERLARGLVAQGVRPGDRVGLAARNSASWVIAFMAVTMAGGVATLLNGWLTGGELADGIRLADCALVLADAERALRLAGERIDAPVISFGHGDPGREFAALGARGEGIALPRPGAEDLASIIFTSGSTGLSKGAASDHRALVQATMNFLAQSVVGLRLRLEAGEAMPPQQVGLVTIPLFHVTGLVPLLLQSLPLGRRLVIMRKWDALEALRLIERERVTYFIGVPLMTHELVTHPRRDDFDLSSCGFFAAGGAARPPEHVTAIAHALPHVQPVLGYGLTETNAVGCTTLGESYVERPASTGPASPPLVELRIIDEAGAPVPAGEVGEVTIRTICAMRGYWRDPEATAAAFTGDGFVRTGDLGWLDGDGYLTIVDRKKDMVIRGGENISCIEVERAIYAHPAVAEVAVFGVPDERLGEVPAAVWVPRDGDGGTEALDEEELRDFLARHLAAYKIPHAMWRSEAPLPRLGSEKIDKPALRRRYIA